jgi:cytochrome b561
MAIALQRYSRVAMALHWLIALAIIGMLVGGKVMHEMLEHKEPMAFTLVQFHKSMGVTILLLSVARLLWRFTHKPPALPAMAGWQTGLAHVSHWGFYFLMFAIPLTGWAMVSTSQYGLPTLLYFTQVEWPHIPFLVGRTDLHETFEESHELLGNITIALLFLHIGAALFHHYLLKDTVLRRMMPGPRLQEK